ncbi:hypothetical protein CFP56_037256 [Quercus suber]|uniref:Uncharacterized protein n=1 Tax=Quercus suber TaxID=58331 RepID=A0AAW0J4Y9_QUESU
MGRRYCCVGHRRSLESSTFLNFDVIVNNFRDSRFLLNFFRWLKNLMDWASSFVFAGPKSFEGTVGGVKEAARAIELSGSVRPARAGQSPSLRVSSTCVFSDLAALTLLVDPSALSPVFPGPTVLPPPLLPLSPSITEVEEFLAWCGYSPPFHFHDILLRHHHC